MDDRGTEELLRDQEVQHKKATKALAEARELKNSLAACRGQPTELADRTQILHRHIRELEQFPQSPDPVIRRRAEFELDNAQDLVRLARNNTADLEEAHETEQQTFVSAASSSSSDGVARYKTPRKFEDDGSQSPNQENSPSKSLGQRAPTLSPEHLQRNLPPDSFVPG